MSGPVPEKTPKIRGTQIGLRNPSLVNRIKADMLSGKYLFQEDRGQIGGVRDRKGDYHVVEGHHRIVAALEILRETGNAGPLQELLRWGNWSEVEKGPIDSRPLPSRHWWGRNFLAQKRPEGPKQQFAHTPTRQSRKCSRHAPRDENPHAEREDYTQASLKPKSSPRRAEKIGK